ncbi:MAG: InlB B-repeat-containing protein [Lentisphaeria bacterium]|nr:InlB B-repeat-containing protein [Lentisphaeria bacterium]
MGRGRLWARGWFVLAAFGISALLRGQTYNIQDYFPVAHDSWWYLVDLVPQPEGDSDAFRWDVLDNEIGVGGGKTAVQFKTTTDETDDDRNGDRDFWRHGTAGELEYWGGYINKIPSPFPKEIILANPLTAGLASMTIGQIITDSETYYYSFVSADVDIRVELVEALDHVETPLGTFTDVIKLRVTIQLTDLPFGVDDIVVSDNFVWLQRGIGVVRQTQGADANDATDQVLDSGFVAGNPITAGGPTTYTLTYSAGEGGSIDGPSPQIVAEGADGDSVTAVPDGGSVFVQWSDGSTENPRQDTNVTADITVTAEFTPMQYTVTFAAGPGGSLLGELTQTVNHGADCSAVEAVPDAGSHFVAWNMAKAFYSDANPLTVTDVTADLDLVAAFEEDAPIGSEIGGLISAGGAGVPGIAVVLPGVGTATTGADGRYRFTEVPDGTYQLFPSGSTEYIFTPPLRQVTVPPTTTVADFAAQPVAGATLVPGPTAIYLAGRDDVTIPAVGVDPDAAGFPLGRVCVGDCPGAVQERFPTAFAAAQGDQFRFNAGGAVDYYGGTTLAAAPDGYAATTSAITPLEGISGYNGPHGSLVGVFLDDANPLGATPPDLLDFSATGLGLGFAALSPQLGQVFFIGDGSTAGKAQQVFTAPAGATRLFLGIADGFAFGGAPGAYDDNIGGFLVTVDRTPAVVQHTLTYSAGDGGSVTGDSLQTVAHGANGTAVTAVPDPGYLFVQWSDGVTTATRQDTNVTASITVEATFEAEPGLTHTVVFIAGANGTIRGAAVQVVAHGDSTSAVTAAANRGYVFDRWDDNSIANPRVLTNVVNDVTLTALFRQAQPVDPNGFFAATVDETDVLNDRGIWDFTGPYAATAKGTAFDLILTHDTKGKIGGGGTVTVDAGVPVAVPVSVKGKASGKGGIVMVSLSLKGSGADAKLSGKVILALDVLGRQLIGSAVIKGTVGGAKVNEVIPLLVFDVPPPMNGTFGVYFNLQDTGRAVSGTAIMMLSNGHHYAFLVKGKKAGLLVAVSLKGDPLDLAAKGIKMKGVIQPLEGGQALIVSAAVKAFGQAFGW